MENTYSKGFFNYAKENVHAIRFTQPSTEELNNRDMEGSIIYKNKPVEADY